MSGEDGGYIKVTKEEFNMARKWLENELERIGKENFVCPMKISRKRELAGKSEHSFIVYRTQEGDYVLVALGRKTDVLGAGVSSTVKPVQWEDGRVEKISIIDVAANLMRKKETLGLEEDRQFESLSKFTPKVYEEFLRLKDPVLIRNVDKYKPIACSDMQYNIKKRAYVLGRLIKGKTLKDYVAEKIGKLLSTEKVVDVFELFVAIAKAIQALHKLGVTHNDIHERNIIIAESSGIPIAHLIDLGTCMDMNIKSDDVFENGQVDIQNICMIFRELLYRFEDVFITEFKKNVSLHPDLSKIKDQIESHQEKLLPVISDMYSGKIKNINDVVSRLSEISKQQAAVLRKPPPIPPRPTPPIPRAEQREPPPVPPRPKKAH